VLRYAITDRARFPGDEATQQDMLLEQAARLALTGIDFLQLREKDLESSALADLARNILVSFRNHPDSPKLLINSRADIAIAVAADGVHLTSAPGSLIPSQIRELYAAANLPAPIVSVSCHMRAEVIRAREEAATLILFGPVFEKVVASQSISSGTGLDLLREACSVAATIPVLALGGITSTNMQSCLDTGAAGVAAIRLFANEHEDRR
jgi:thiamine-phosphate pyrophosphorylase